ncbi:MAG: LPS export ABC transporter periplasmic protein LptC [Xanthomonadales bacterium]|nr:LPS export ABC transporter periplasmic protein LptC [Xanthomonadales bacterium]
MNWSEAGLIAALGVLGVGSYVLLEQLAKQVEQGREVVLPEVDYRLRELTLVQYAEDTGLPELRLSARELTHLRVETRALLDRPVIDSARPDGDLRIRAARATLDQTTRTIAFEERVEVRRREPERDPVLAQMPTLLVDLKARTGATDDPVTIDQGSSKLSGIGLDIDLEQENFSLRRDVRAVFNRPAAAP